MDNTEIKKICKHFKINNFKITKEGIVNVDGDVNLMDMELEELPINFGIVNGTFDISCNKLTSLKGCPEYVGNHFFCNNNRLKSLEFAPKKVGNNFICSFNYLKSLKFSPSEINGSFFCNDNSLTDLTYAPNKINYNFYFNNNFRLKSLKGIPNKINGIIDSSSNTNIYDLEDITSNLMFDKFINLTNTPLSFYSRKWTEEDVSFFKELSPVRLIDNKYHMIMDRLEMFLLVRDKTLNDIDVNTLKHYYTII